MADDWEEEDTPVVSTKASSGGGGGDWNGGDTEGSNSYGGGKSYGDRNGSDGRGRGRGSGRGGRGGRGGGFNRERNDNGDGEDGGGGGGRGGRSYRGGRGGGDGEENGERSERGGGRGRDGDETKAEGEAEEAPKERYCPSEVPEGDELFSERTTDYDGSGINFDAYESIPVSISENRKCDSVETFEQLGLRPLVLDNVKKVGYKRPTPIQKHASPVIISKQDLMACAQTGSGKTAAFLLPIINTLLAEDLPAGDDLPARPYVLILAPTRELALQIDREAHMYSSGSILKSICCYGGTALFYQKNQLRRGCHILVATPGRLKQFITEKHVDLSNLKYFVLDEADRMLDMGFMSDIKEIVKTMPPKGERISAMFSATFPRDIQTAAAEFLNDYVFVVIGIVGGACADVEQVFYQVERREKRAKVLEILGDLKDNDKVLIFCNAKKGADFLAGTLSTNNISSTSIHGDRLQSQRETALREFVKGQRKVLVATAVAARGLDIPKVTMVINYDLPKEIEEYVHRIGRTGRVGHTGKAISFYEDEDAPLTAALVKILTDCKQTVPDFLGSSSSGGGLVGAFGAVDNRQAISNGAPAAVNDEDEAWDD
ncbi:unnamed protein product [Allacma fusca]|uniref:RNA helicase n=1 Tax=Allacma fusca TaxID=39272 RepID=A0A8J2P9H5_9HEXA|nr:unnamed protein product [Allacma fusca]